MKKNVQYNIQYEEVEFCPLCGCDSIIKTKLLSRTSYFFGEFDIPLPESGVFLRECSNCKLLFKSIIPTKMSLGEVMSISATKVWQSKKGLCPAVEYIHPYLTKDKSRILDIGASNGDLLDQLKQYADCLSALDIVIYPRCENIVNGEYIICDIEKQMSWSGKGYDIVIGFDIFEHFTNPTNAISNISSLLIKGGKLIVETGDWTYYKDNLGKWYYTNLFEHQIFWNNQSIRYLCEKFDFKLLEYSRVKHKNLRNISIGKHIIINIIVNLAKFSWFKSLMILLGKGDPSRFTPPFLTDHAFIVLEKL